MRTRKIAWQVLATTIPLWFLITTTGFLKTIREAKPPENPSARRAADALRQRELAQLASKHIKPCLVYRGNALFTLTEPYGATVVSQGKSFIKASVAMAPIVDAKKGTADPEIPGHPCLGQLWGKPVQFGKTKLRLAKVTQALGDGKPEIGQTVFYNLEAAAIDGPLPPRGYILAWSAK